MRVFILRSECSCVYEYLCLYMVTSKKKRKRDLVRERQVMYIISWTFLVCLTALNLSFIFSYGLWTCKHHVLVHWASSSQYMV
jgi:hypothetical protein